LDLNINPEQLALATEEFKRLEPTLIKTKPGQFVVIDPLSKEYWISPILASAFRLAKDKYSDRLFYSFKIGSPTTMRRE